ncbi:MAG: pilus assembly protein [Pirellulaceae bacterium]|nr:pilus assembly protein [Pirellulaceae bacterium]
MIVSRKHSAKRRLKSKPKKRMGAAMVEFAIVANVMFVVILTCMEFARMNMVRNLAQDAAYFAARHAIVPGATKDEAVAEADRIISSLVTSGYTIDVSDLDSDSNEVVVTVSVDLDAVALFAPMFLPNSTIETTAHMSTERYDHFYQQ